MKTKDGGPAFPDQGQRMEADGTWNQQWSPGMSLRGWFAGQALAGWLASMSAEIGPLDVKMDALAPIIYRWADAMLAAREEK